MSSTKKVKELQQRREEVFQGGGEKAIQKQVAMGKMTARDRVLAIVDHGSFNEISRLDHCRPHVLRHPGRGHPDQTIHARR